METEKDKFVVTYMIFSADGEPFVVEEDVLGCHDADEVRYRFKIDHPDAEILNIEWIDLN